MPAWMSLDFQLHASARRSQTQLQLHLEYGSPTNMTTTTTTRLMPPQQDLTRADTQTLAAATSEEGVNDARHRQSARQTLSGWDETSADKEDEEDSAPRRAGGWMFWGEWSVGEGSRRVGDVDGGQEGLETASHILVLSLPATNTAPVTLLLSVLESWHASHAPLTRRTEHEWDGWVEGGEEEGGYRKTRREGEEEGAMKRAEGECQGESVEFGMGTVGRKIASVRCECGLVCGELGKGFEMTCANRTKGGSWVAVSRRNVQGLCEPEEEQALLSVEQVQQVCFDCQSVLLLFSSLCRVLADLVPSFLQLEIVWMSDLDEDGENEVAATDQDNGHGDEDEDDMYNKKDDSGIDVDHGGENHDHGDDNNAACSQVVATGSAVLAAGLGVVVGCVCVDPLLL